MNEAALPFWISLVFFALAGVYLLFSRSSDDEGATGWMQPGEARTYLMGTVILAAFGLLFLVIAVATAY